MKLIILDGLFTNPESGAILTPILTLKPDTSLLRNNNAFFIPDFSNEIISSLFLVIKINKMGKCISPSFAHRYYNEIGIGVNFTAKDILKKCIQEAKPQEEAYAFDNSSAISPKFLKKQELPENFKIQLKINEAVAQEASIKQMQAGIDALISYISKNITLKIGDYVLLGTPAGSCEVKIGDRLQAELNGKLLLDFLIQ